MKNDISDFDAALAPRPKRWLLWIGAAALACFALLAVAVQFLAPRIVETEKLREFVSARAGRALGGNAGLHSLDARGFWINSLGLVVTASPPRSLTELRAHELSTSFSLLELWRGRWRLDHITVGHLQAAYGPEAARLVDRAEFSTPELVPPSERESIMKVDIKKVSIARGDLFWNDPQKDGGQLRDVQVTCFPDGKNLTAQGRGGTLRQARFPETRITGFKVYYEKPSLRIDEGRLALGERGSIDVTGGFRFEQNAAIDLQLKFAHCPIAPFLPEKNRNKLQGTFTADAHVQKVVGKSDALSANGTASVETATLANVGALEKAAVFAGKKQLHPLRLEELRGAYRFEAGKLSVRDFGAEAPQVLSVRGSFRYEDGEIDGTFELGIAPDIVAKFPGAREEVFTRAEGDYLWTRVHVSGPLSKPRDDLKPRLLAALQKHTVLGILTPLLKSAQGAREVIELLSPD